MAESHCRFFLGCVTCAQSPHFEVIGRDLVRQLAAPAIRGPTPSPIAPFTVKDEVTEDAIAAINLLMKMPEINKQQIYLLGHSLGGMLAARIAAEDQRVAGIMVMAGSARPLGKVVADEVKYIAGLSPVQTPEYQKQVAKAIAAQVESPSLKPDTTVDFFALHLPGLYFLDLRNQIRRRSRPAQNSDSGTPGRAGLSGYGGGFRPVEEGTGE